MQPVWDQNYSHALSLQTWNLRAPDKKQNQSLSSYQQLTQKSLVSPPHCWELSPVPKGTWNLEGRPRATSDTSFIPLSTSPNPKTPVLRSSEISPRSRQRVSSEGPGWLYSLSADVSFLESANSTIHAASFSENQKFLVFQETESSPSLFCDFGCMKCFSFEQWYQMTRNQALSSWDLAQLCRVFSDCTS